MLGQELRDHIDSKADLEQFKEHFAGFARQSEFSKAQEAAEQLKAYVYHELLPTVLRTADEIQVLRTAEKPSAEHSKIEELF